MQIDPFARVWVIYSNGKLDMVTGSLQVNRDIILATRKQFLRERQKHTPEAAVTSLAHMQHRPRPVLNYASDGVDITIIAQISRREIYDPVSSALHCIVHGAQAISFFTDHAIYKEDFDDLVMVARAVKDVPVIYQNYTLDEYGVMSARAADASGLVAYASLLQEGALKKVVGLTQRWKMSVLVQINDAHELEHALELSPHALCFGENLSSNVRTSVENLAVVRDSLPHHVRVLLMNTLRSLDDVELALRARVDALIVDEELLKNEKAARALHAMVDQAKEKRSGEL
jgi:indole-3-glycerol phosphate synthase